jgi:hypothetical protein
MRALFVFGIPVVPPNIESLFLSILPKENPRNAGLDSLNLLNIDQPQFQNQANFQSVLPDWPKRNQRAIVRYLGSKTFALLRNLASELEDLNGEHPGLAWTRFCAMTQVCFEHAKQMFGPKDLPSPTLVDRDLEQSQLWNPDTDRNNGVRFRFLNLYMHLYVCFND